MLRLILLALLLAPSVALAQEAPALEPGTPLWAFATLAMAIAAVISALVPEDKVPGWLKPIMSLINLVGANVGNARNDPAAQARMGGAPASE